MRGYRHVWSESRPFTFDQSFEFEVAAAGDHRILLVVAHTKHALAKQPLRVTRTEPGGRRTRREVAVAGCTRITGASTGARDDCGLDSESEGLLHDGPLARGRHRVDIGNLDPVAGKTVTLRLYRKR